MEFKLFITKLNYMLLLNRNVCRHKPVFSILISTIASTTSKIKRYVHVVETQIVHFCLLSHDLSCPTQPNVINKISSYQKNVYIIQYTYFRRPHILVQYCRSVEIFIRSQYFYLIYSPYNYPRICCI